MIPGSLSRTCKSSRNGPGYQCWRMQKVLLLGCNSTETDYSLIIIRRAREGEADWRLCELLTEIHGSLKLE